MLASSVCWMLITPTTNDSGTDGQVPENSVNRTRAGGVNRKPMTDPKSTDRDAPDPVAPAANLLAVDSPPADQSVETSAMATRR